MHLLESVEESVRFIKARINLIPKNGIVLGTGLSGFSEELTER